MSELSTEGRARREMMLAELTAAMTQTHRLQRRRRRAAAVCGGIALLLLTAVAVQSMFISSLGSNPVGNRNPAGATPPTVAGLSPVVDLDRGCVIRIVRTDADAVKRLGIEPEPSATILDDESLLAELTALKRPAGLIRHAGQVRITRTVTDRNRGDSPPPSPPGSPL